MNFTTVLIIAGVIMLAIFFLIARLAIRWTVRAIIVSIILIALTGVAGFWWWTSRLAPAAPRTRTAPAKRTPSR